MADNHRIKNIYYMLSYAYQSLRETGYKNVASEDFDNVHDLFAAILACGVGSQVKRGLHREYIPQEEALSGLRGQIRVAESIKQQTLSQGKLVCGYDEFTEDSIHNRVLKATMLMSIERFAFYNKGSLKQLIIEGIEVQMDELALYGVSEDKIVKP